VSAGQAGATRCPWCGDDPLYVEYHDREWGVPARDDAHLFEMLVLEGAQAGLSWLTILRKRENYRRAFDGFDPERMARYGEARVRSLLADAGIVRNRLKIAAAVDNARAFLAVREAHGSFARLVWSFVDGAPRINAWRSLSELPASTPESDRMSRELKRLGFRFVGSTICYAFMQSVGLVNDHLVDCFRYRQCAAAGARPESTAKRIGTRLAPRIWARRRHGGGAGATRFTPAAQASAVTVTREPGRASMPTS
jgi:DNA-3-methyladenine glycosylase I